MESRRTIRFICHFLESCWTCGPIVWKTIKFAGVILSEVGPRAFSPAREPERRTLVLARRASTCTCIPGYWVLLFQQVPRDHQPLDLARTLTDGAQLHVAIKLLRRIIFDEPIAAMDLHALIGATHGDLAGIKLRHCGLLRGLESGVFHRRRTHGQQARRIDLSGHVGQLPLDSLEFADGLPELLARLGILQRRLICPLRHSQSKRGDRDAPTVEHLHRIDESLAFLPAHRRCRYYTIF